MAGEEGNGNVRGERIPGQDFRGAADLGISLFRFS
jgi:hypothetical protein